jgi:hypothetical protein
LPAAAPIAFRRLTGPQFWNSLSAVLGGGVERTPLEPDPRASGLSVVDAARVVTSTTGVEQYQTAVESAVAELFDDVTRREAFLGCAPALGALDACVSQVISRSGRLAFRRSLTPDEQARYLGLAESAGAALGDAVQGLHWSLVAMLQSPKFLYRSELGAEALPDGRRALMPLELASKLSYFMWNAPPDSALLDAA